MKSFHFALINSTPSRHSYTFEVPKGEARSALAAEAGGEAELSKLLLAFVSAGDACCRGRGVEVLLAWVVVAEGIEQGQEHAVP